MANPTPRPSVRLVPHPSSAIGQVRTIEAETWRDEGGWHFRYLVERASDVILPSALEPARADGLWQTTCFESFVATGAESYLELNFAPSSEWAAYRFRRSREGMEHVPADVQIGLQRGADWIALEATVQCEDLHSGAALGLAAVIESKDGSKSYWALAHAGKKPDFHDRDCFIARLP